MVQIKINIHVYSTILIVMQNISIIYALLKKCRKQRYFFCLVLKFMVNTTIDIRSLYNVEVNCLGFFFYFFLSIFAVDYLLN